MKQRTRSTLSWLLSLALALSLIPASGGTARALDGGAYKGLVPTGDNGENLSEKQVTFNGDKWYIIKDESESATKGTLTLLFAGNLGNVAFDTGGSNDYDESSIKKELAEMTEIGYYYPVAGAINNTDNGKLYLLSTEEAGEAGIVPKNVLVAFDSTAWWLRSPGAEGKVAYVYVEDQKNPGRIAQGGLPTYSFGLRPALQLDLSKVDFDATSRKFTVKTPADTDLLIQELDKRNSEIDLSKYYLIPAEDMYFTSKEYWNFKEPLNKPHMLSKALSPGIF